MVARALRLRPVIERYMLQDNSDVLDEGTAVIGDSHWACYGELLDPMEDIKRVCLRLDGSEYATISDVLLLVTRLLYERLDPAQAQKEGKCYKKDFITAFRMKLIKLCDDVNQFFLWAFAASLDGRHQDLSWLQVLWTHKAEWPAVTGYYRTLGDLRKEIDAEITEQVRC